MSNELGWITATSSGGSTPPTFDVAINGKSTTNNTTASASGTIGSGSNRIAIAIVSWLATSTQTISTLTQGSNNFTVLDSQTWTFDGVPAGIAVCQLNNPDSGSVTINLTMSGNTEVKFINVLCYSGRNISSPLGVISKGTGTTTSAALSPASALNDIVLGGLYCPSSSPPGTDPAAGPTNNRYADDEAVVEGSAVRGGDMTATAGTTTFTYTSVDNSFTWGIIGVALKAA